MANESMADFEEELKKSFRVIKEGEIVKGMIVDINDEVVTLDLGYYEYPGGIGSVCFGLPCDLRRRPGVHSRL